MREVYVEVAGVPVPQGSMRAFANKSGRPYVTHANPALKGWREKVSLSVQMENFGGEPLFGPIEAHFAFVLPKPPSASRAKPYVKPDLDKLIRAALDACTMSGVICDDAQVVVLHASKVYCFPNQEAMLKLHLREMS